MADASAPDTSVTAPAPIADLPSGDPIPSSAAPAHAPKRKPLPLGALLAALPSNADSFLTRLEKCLSTPAGIDTVMLFLCYTSKFGSAALAALSRSALQRSAREWIALVSTLPRGTTVLFASAAASPKAAAAGVGAGAAGTAARALALSKKLGALSGLLSEARMILRLWALLGMYFWARKLVRQTFSSKPANANEKATTNGSVGPTKLETAIEYLRLALCITFQSLENGAYLSGRGILSWTPAQQGQAYKWSARFWAAYVGIEIGRLFAERFDSSSHSGFATKSAAEKTEWTKKTARQLAWAPLTVHWGSEKGLVSDMTVGLLASIPGVIQMRDLWASTA
ncbi:hypothetical protein B0J18DRAFT_429077 [Chaetomium sp. MPI-SDFR-AT-0129]|nr:hypothetical protein B0J18DRAFT_429077 [Chaetomium sp. MPI-SDFR-AT-0129]